MRFSVGRRRVCPGEEKRTLRKDAFWLHALTEKRILQPPSHGKAHSGGVTLTEKYILYAGPHGKAHSATPISRKDAPCAGDAIAT